MDMMGRGPARVAVDLMGGDHAPEAVIAGIRIAREAGHASVVAVGPADLRASIESETDAEFVVADQVVSMDEHPAAAVRSRPESTMAVGCRLVKEGAADAFFTCGNTGAALAAGLLYIGRIPGIKRPALATVVPATERVPVLLDIGANADCKPENLVQFAMMGREYARAALGTDQPTVGLLNIGEEPIKGSQLALAAHELMKDTVPGFFGNVEGRDIPQPPVDVIVTDGFTGNVAVKLIEGTAKALLGAVADAFRSTLASRLGAALAMSGLASLKDRLDPDEYGGAPLLGVDGVLLVGHGSSGPEAVASGIRMAARVSEQGLPSRIAATL
ncbi:MAG: phosphate acyltransferase PlsX [Coriobacteriia bacterium]